jgi:hypothetical protein
VTASSLLEFAQLAMVPVVGLLWRISTQLATLTAQMQAHGARLELLERAEHHA